MLLHPSHHTTQMLSLVLLTVATLRIVYVRLVDKKVQCLDAATQLHIEQGTTYLEAMPGVYFEIGSKVCLFFFNSLMSRDPKVTNPGGFISLLSTA